MNPKELESRAQNELIRARGFLRHYPGKATPKMGKRKTGPSSKGDKSTVLELTTPNSGELNQVLDASQILMLPAQG